ncbi:hypothetical protein EPN28_02160 [Patescibacteria group bacterium]|nr:MAG: hypothetical protein EPN28_02160 [Patescibacteria group bacterium]
MTKKFFLVLGLILIATGLLFYKQIRRALGITVTPNALPLIEFTSVNIPEGGFTPVLGNPGADITVVEFADFACGECKKIHYGLSDYIAKNPQKARLIWRGVPAGKWYAAGNTLSHQASYCADKQGKFWQFAAMAMSDKNNLTEAGLKKMAEGLNLNLVAWGRCANSEEAKQAVTANSDIAAGLGIRALPGIFINNRRINLDAQADIVEILKKFVEKE